MFPMVVAFVAAMLFAWHTAITQPKEIAFRSAVAGDVAAANFWAYRSAVSNYQYSNPSFTGTVADSSLTFQLGYIRDPAWTNVIQNGTLYTFSNVSLLGSTVDAIARRGGRTLMIGIAQPAGTMTSLSGAASGFVLPVSVPAGAMVVIGN